MHKSTRIGISWIISRTFIMASIMTIARALAEGGMSNYAIMFWQNAFALPYILLYTAYRKEIPRTTKYHLHITRSLLGVSSGLLLFYGLSKMQLNNATAITFMGPLFSALAAIIFLKEKAGIHRIIGLFLGLCGVLIILRPGTEAFNPAAIFLIMTAFIWGLTDITIKTLVRTESTHALLFYMCIFLMLLSIPFGVFHWHTPSLKEALLCATMALFHLGNFATVSKAFKHADVSVLMPFEFFRLIFASAFALALFNERLSLAAVSGSLVILGASIYVAHKEKKANDTKI